MRPRYTALPIAMSVLFLVTGCAPKVPDLRAQRFFEKLNQYPQTADPLKVPRLTEISYKQIPTQTISPDVFIMVHPAYSLFFPKGDRSKYSEAKYALLAAQFENEARFLAEASKAGKIIILIVPGEYESESIAPLSYTAYLNDTTAGSSAVFHLFSDSTSSGSVPMDDMVDLYRFLTKIGAGRVLIGGGYIGRCQREFHKEFTRYFNLASTFIVPEISTISPDDITEAEAGSILESVQRLDYSLVRKFMDRKLENSASVLSITQQKDL